MKIELHCTRFVQCVKNPKYNQYPPFTDFLERNLLLFQHKTIENQYFCKHRWLSVWLCAKSKINWTKQWLAKKIVWKSQNFSFPVCCHCWWHSCGVSQRSQQQTDDLFQHTIPTEKGSKQGLTKNLWFLTKKTSAIIRILKTVTIIISFANLKTSRGQTYHVFQGGILSREATQTNKKPAKTEDWQGQYKQKLTLKTPE